MRKPIIHCKNCKYFLKNKKDRKVKVNNVNPLMNQLIASGKEVIYDGVCIKTCCGVNIENKCSQWKYRENKKEISYTQSKGDLSNYKCENQLSIYDIIKERK